jgi:hypothetical protein
VTRKGMATASSRIATTAIRLGRVLSSAMSCAYDV